MLISLLFAASIILLLRYVQPGRLLVSSRCRTSPPPLSHCNRRSRRCSRVRALEEMDHTLGRSPWRSPAVHRDPGVAMRARLAPGATREHIGAFVTEAPRRYTGMRRLSPAGSSRVGANDGRLESEQPIELDDERAILERGE